MLLPHTGLDFTIKEVMGHMERGAEFYWGTQYRTRLYRDWDRGKPGVLFIMLNPSMADDQRDDPTVRRCIGFAHRWGYGWLEVRNIFALVSTDPKALREVEDPIGLNPMVYEDDCFDKIILAWGNHGEILGRGREVIWKLARIQAPIRYRRKRLPIYHLGLTKTGQPKHPLYLRGDTEPKPVVLEELEKIWKS